MKKEYFSTGRAKKRRETIFNNLCKMKWNEMEFRDPDCPGCRLFYEQKITIQVFILYAWNVGMFYLSAARPSLYFIHSLNPFFHSKKRLFIICCDYSQRLSEVQISLKKRRKTLCLLLSS